MIGIDSWPVVISCDGITCGRCNRPIVRKRLRSRIHLPFASVAEAVADHAAACSTAGPRVVPPTHKEVP